MGCAVRNRIATTYEFLAVGKREFEEHLAVNPFLLETLRDLPFEATLPPIAGQAARGEVLCGVGATEDERDPVVDGAVAGRQFDPADVAALGAEEFAYHGPRNRSVGT